MGKQIEVSTHSITWYHACILTSLVRQVLSHSHYSFLYTCTFDFQVWFLSRAVFMLNLLLLKVTAVAYSLIGWRIPSMNILARTFKTKKNLRSNTFLCIGFFHSHSYFNINNLGTVFTASIGTFRGLWYRWLLLLLLFLLFTHLLSHLCIVIHLCFIMNQYKVICIMADMLRCEARIGLHNYNELLEYILKKPGSKKWNQLLKSYNSESTLLVPYITRIHIHYVYTM